MPTPLKALLILALLPLAQGCTHSAPAGIPGGSKLVAESPARLVHVTTETGTIYLYGREVNGVIYSTGLATGQSFMVEAFSNRIMIDGKPVADMPPVSNKAHYELYFKPYGKREYHPMYNP